ncbi:DNA-directed RNA polymerase subunit H [Candidatus Woesearchaeota archaeon]|jgi:DNA-directed RNA polymerase subunit H|nr:DNA-directed RNA polymerase subunit H [Candidatus Woesearchaeota archaeon]|tara:strand:- start:182 stop:418 length:237 start_codon:yes stop_codon:yes gene_type:complete
MAKEQIKHTLIPEHKKLSEKEKKELIEKYNLKFRDLPKILLTDPAIIHLDPKEKDIIKITRQSPTAGIALFYRGVING